MPVTRSVTSEPCPIPVCPALLHPRLTISELGNDHYLIGRHDCNNYPCRVYLISGTARAVVHKRLGSPVPTSWLYCTVSFILCWLKSICSYDCHTRTSVFAPEVSKKLAYAPLFGGAASIRRDLPAEFWKHLSEFTIQCIPCLFNSLQMQTLAPA